MSGFTIGQTPATSHGSRPGGHRAARGALPGRRTGGLGRGLGGAGGAQGGHAGLGGVRGAVRGGGAHMGGTPKWMV